MFFYTDMIKTTIFSHECLLSQVTLTPNRDMALDIGGMRLCRVSTTRRAPFLECRPTSLSPDFRSPMATARRNGFLWLTGLRRSEEIFPQEKAAHASLSRVGSYGASSDLHHHKDLSPIDV